ncbi:cullin-like protein [Trifolium medium]|uniref:Cullin-like protein n=1 Tax=Trifolium medium TaxID=97028 RepID=A0A392MFA3_9FABA|nr:cullin-like protein [Trifolium medium]
MEGTSSPSAQVDCSKIPIDTLSKETNFTKNKTINISEQEWMNFFKILNGPVYPILVKDFWPRCEIYDEHAAEIEYQMKVAEDPENNKGKSRKDLGLSEFKETEIRSGVTGYKATLTQSHIAKLLNIPNNGVFITFKPGMGRKSSFVGRIAKKCYLQEDIEPSNKVKDMKDTQRLLARIMLGSFFPREGGTDQLSWDHRHFIYFLTVGTRMNLPAYIFHHLCKSIRSAQHPTKLTPQIAYPRLLSDLFYQCAVTDRIARTQQMDLLEEVRALFIDGSVFVMLGLIKPGSLKHPTQPLLENITKEPIPENPPVLFSNEPPEVILAYISMMKAEGIRITAADIAQVSPVDKKKRKRVIKEVKIKKRPLTKHHHLELELLRSSLLMK